MTACDRNFRTILRISYFKWYDIPKHVNFRTLFTHAIKKRAFTVTIHILTTVNK